MKVLLHFEKEKLLRQSGIGRALRHQKKALRSAGIEYTQSTTDSFDLVHTNTLFGKSFRMMRKFQKKVCLLLYMDILQLKISATLLELGS